MVPWGHTKGLLKVKEGSLWKDQQAKARQSVGTDGVKESESRWRAVPDRGDGTYKGPVIWV